MVAITNGMGLGLQVVQYWRTNDFVSIAMQVIYCSKYSSKVWD